MNFQDQTKQKYLIYISSFHLDKQWVSLIWRSISETVNEVFNCHRLSIAASSFKFVISLIEAVNILSFVWN